MIRFEHPVWNNYRMRQTIAILWQCCVQVFFIAVTIAAVDWVVESFTLSQQSQEWSWFARSGSVLTCAGALLAVMPLLRMGITGLVARVRSVEHDLPGTRTWQDRLCKLQTQLDGYAYPTGLSLLVIGTLIWGYGDLVGPRISVWLLRMIG